MPVMKASLLSIFVTSFVVGLSGALMPGPLLALTISEVARHGFWAGPALIVGHAIGELITVIALAKGLGKLLKHPIAFGVIGLAGGGFLLWMGYGILITWNSTLLPGFDATTTSTSAFSGSIVVSGLVVSITNPYWVLWWATVGSTYVALSIQKGKVPGLSVFYTGHILSDIAWYTIVSLGIAGGTAIVSPAWYEGLLLACGIALLGLGGYFILSGIRSFYRSVSSRISEHP
ncbi:LysE family translocator [Chloroflexota bacterium]